MSGITLDADSVRDEVNARFDVHTDHNVTARDVATVYQISDERIDDVIWHMVDDDFWQAYDDLRDRVIDQLLSEEKKT